MGKGIISWTALFQINTVHTKEIEGNNKNKTRRPPKETKEYRDEKPKPNHQSHRDKNGRRLLGVVAKQKDSKQTDSSAGTETE